VTTANGAVRLAGVLPDDAFRDEVLATCRSLPEVREISADWLGSHVEPV
jgi:hypothetical protein